jgi:acyl-CoA synthetase (AMP-forming)/AMP-acid ligase II/thioesterase domain-containing protein
MRDLGVASGNGVKVAPARSGRLGEGRPLAAPEQAAASNEPRTIGEALRAHAALRPEQAAIVASELAPVSYRRLTEQIEEVRAALRQAGFDASARIVVAIPDSAPAALAIVAVACSAVALPLDPKLTLPEIEARLILLRPSAVLLPRGSRTAARTAAEQQGIAVIEAIAADDGKLGLQLLAPQVGAALPLHEPDPSAPAFILQTSGTTADPNLVPFSHRNMLAAAKRLQGWFDLVPQDRCLCASPICYSNGVKMTLLTPLLTGGSVAFPANASKVDLSEWLGELAPTWYSVGPTLHLAILDKAKSQPDVRSTHSLRFVASGGAALPIDVHDGLRTALGVPVLEHYASSETAQVSSNLPPPGPYKPGTCGVPSPDIVMIVGEDGRRLPPGEQGDILVGGPTVTSGYIDAPELNRSVFVDGWFRTGDIGSLDEEGFLTIRGRRKELINRGSEKIAPLEIDRALKRHPQVAEAAAYGVAHPRLGEDVAAAVVLHPGASVTGEELREFLGAQLAAFKIPRRIDIVDQLPKGVTGKVQRKRLSARSNAPSAQTPATDWQAELLQLWRKFLKTENVSVDDDFFEKGGDSLLAMDLHMEIERLTGQELPESILLEASTVRALAKRLARTAPAQQRPVQAAAGDGRPVLVFFHDGDAAGGALVASLQRGLGSEPPVLAIGCPDGKTMPRSIQNTAAAQLAAILRAQPHGPYRLGGYRNGALVALQAARLLVAAGREVALVALVDPPTITAHRPLQFLLSLVGRIARKQGTDATAGDVPAPLAVPLLVVSSGDEGRAWRRVSADVELIDLPGRRDEWVASHAAAVTSYLRARLQSIGDSRSRNETTRGVL